MRKMSRLLLCALPLLLASGCVLSSSKEQAVKKCLSQATEQEKQGDYQGALNQLNQALTLDPRTEAPWRAEGW